MTEDQLRLFESEFDIELPADYRNAVLTGVFPRMGDSDYLIDDFEQVLQENRDCRESGYHGLQWQPHYFLFGADENDDRYFFDLSQEPPSIWYANGDTGERELETDTFAEWLEFAFQLEADKQDELNEERDENNKMWSEQAVAEAKNHEFPQITNTKSWWQFWK